MIEYFNNRPFIESIPGNSNNGVKPGKGNSLICLILATTAGILVGYLIQQIVNKKRTAMIIKENEELKNSQK
jgi:hypothetical protein